MQHLAERFLLLLMETAVIINNLYKWVYILFIALFIQTQANATCNKSYTLGFFNGVWNTQDQATSARDALRILIGDTYSNEPVQYESFYNHTGTSVGATALQDIAETFIQRSNEIDESGELGKRFEYFWEFIGSSEPTFLDKLAAFLPNAASLFESVYTAITTKFAAIISYMISNPPTEADYESHNARLDALAAEGEKLMLVAHSQGNLFMNRAYDHVLPVATLNRVVAAHIAPASPTLRGDYVLADIDIVINTLRIQGATSVPANNLELNASSVDYSGHTLIGTYLDETRQGRERVKTMIEMSMQQLKCYTAQAILSIYPVRYKYSGYPWGISGNPQQANGVDYSPYIGKFQGAYSVWYDDLLSAFESYKQIFPNAEFIVSNQISYEHPTSQCNGYILQPTDYSNLYYDGLGGYYGYNFGFKIKNL